MKERTLKVFKARVQAYCNISAGRKLKKKYPFSRIIAYRFEEDFRYKQEKDYQNRFMEVLFIKNSKKIWREVR